MLAVHGYNSDCCTYRYDSDVVPTDVRKHKIDPRQLTKLSHRVVKVYGKVVFVYTHTYTYV